MATRWLADQHVRTGGTRGAPSHVGSAAVSRLAKVVPGP
jgi:hypothetical protein